MTDQQKGRGPEQQQTPIIIIKKHGGHGGHHGGAWKVAYADFVTSMMCLFIVLWIVNQSEDVKKAVAGYFRDPGAFHELTNGGLGGASLLPDPGAGFMPVDRASAQKALEEAAGELREELAGMEHFQQLASQIEIRLTDDGLNIQLVESPNSLFFDLGSSNLSPAAGEVLDVLARELGKLPNKLAIEGHTDSRPYRADAAFTNWELSADRANSARRFMIEHGIRQAQVAEVAGYADTRLRNPDNPGDVSNRRISITVLYDQDRSSPTDRPLPHHQ